MYGACASPYISLSSESELSSSSWSLDTIRKNKGELRRSREQKMRCLLLVNHVVGLACTFDPPADLLTMSTFPSKISRPSL
jgi:hypothetical protein